MRTLLGQWGGAIGKPRLHAATLLLLIFAAIFLAMPETANAQLWVSSGFKQTPNAQTETAYCSTSAVNPATGQPSSTAANYLSFTAECSVTPSTGTVITSTNCPVGAWIRSYPDTGNPTGQCSIVFQPQPGVTYTINSTHALWFYPSFVFAGSPDPNCPKNGFNEACWWDPEGYFTFSPTGHTAPAYSTTGVSITQEVTCSGTGPCTPEDIPQTYAITPTEGYGVLQVWVIAHSSAVYTDCPTPTITSLLPKTWFAGKSYDITITGTGFNPTAVEGCPVTPVVAKVAKGSSLALSGVTVVSPTQITVTVEPGASDPTGNAAITVGNSSTTGAVSVRTQILGNQIQWTQNSATSTISTTDGSTPPTQNAVVGQQIALTTTTPTTTAYDGAPVSQTWTVGGTNIGGYTATTASASITATTLNQTSLTTYWIDQGDSIPVTYQYCVNIQGASPIHQCSLPANATFTVDGPIEADVTTSDETVGISPDQSVMAWGIRFTSSASTPSQTPGAFKWVQLVKSDNVNLYFHDGTSMVCTLGPGLDASYPYAEGITAEDGPSVPLDASSDEVEVTDSTQFQMYLMWDPETSSSIPVPLGHLPWTISGDALYNSGTSAWSLNSGASATSSSSFVVSSAYPIWNKTLSGTINIQTDCN